MKKHDCVYLVEFEDYGDLETHRWSVCATLTEAAEAAKDALCDDDALHRTVRVVVYERTGISMKEEDLGSALDAVEQAARREWEEALRRFAE